MFMRFFRFLRCALVLWQCSSAARRKRRIVETASRIHVEFDQAANDSNGAVSNISASNPVLNGMAVALDVGLDALSKVPVTAIINMNAKWTQRQQGAIAEWYERDDPQGWAANSLGFRALEMIFFAMSDSPLVSDDDGCAWTDKDGRRTKDTRGQTPMRLKWDLYYTAHMARAYRKRFEASYKAKDPIRMEVGGWATDKRLAQPKTFISSRAQQVMRCAIETVKKSWSWPSVRGQKLYTIAEDVSELLTFYGRKNDPAVSADMSLKLAALPFPEGGRCEGDASWAIGHWALYCKGQCTIDGRTSSNAGWGGTTGEHMVPFPLRDKDTLAVNSFSFTKPWGYTHYLMHLMSGNSRSWFGGSPDWRVKCIGGVAAQISVDNEKTWYSWSGFDGTYYADFDLFEADSTSTDGYALSMYSYMKKV